MSVYEPREGDIVEAIEDIDGHIKQGWRGAVQTVGEERYFGVYWPELDTGWGLSSRTAGRHGWEVHPEDVRLVSAREEPPIIEWWKDENNE